MTSLEPVDPDVRFLFFLLALVVVDFGNHSFGMTNASGQFGSGDGNGSGNMMMHGLQGMNAQNRNISYGGSGLGGKEIRLRKFRLEK